MFISILILEAIDCTQKSKRFSSQSSLHAFKMYICIYKEQNGHLNEENQQCMSRGKEKGKMYMNELENDNSDIL